MSVVASQFHHTTLSFVSRAKHYCPGGPAPVPDDANRLFTQMQGMAEWIASRFVTQDRGSPYRRSGWMHGFADDLKQAALTALWEVVRCPRSRAQATSLRDYAAKAIWNAVKKGWMRLSRADRRLDKTLDPLDVHREKSEEALANLADESMSQLTLLIAAEEAEQLLESLPDADLKAFARGAFIDDKTTETLAQELGVTLRTAQRRVEAAREMLRAVHAQRSR